LEHITKFPLVNEAFPAIFLFRPTWNMERPLSSRRMDKEELKVRILEGEKKRMNIDYFANPPSP